MAKKCLKCGEKLEEDELGKVKGTTIKKLVGEKNELEYVCSDCQRNQDQKV